MWVMLSPLEERGQGRGGPPASRTLADTDRPAGPQPGCPARPEPRPRTSAREKGFASFGIRTADRQAAYDAARRLARRQN